MASRTARPRSDTSRADAVEPENAGNPKFNTDRRTYGMPVRSATASRRVALNSQARSRRTACRMRLFDRTRASRGSCFLSGSSSVRRSSRAGCSRSCGRICSAMIVGEIRRLRATGSYRDLPDLHEGHVFSVGGDDALAETAVHLRANLLPHGLARQHDRAVLRLLRAWISRRNERHRLATVLEEEVGRHPDDVTQV